MRTLLFGWLAVPAVVAFHEIPVGQHLLIDFWVRQGRCLQEAPAISLPLTDVRPRFLQSAGFFSEFSVSGQDRRAVKYSWRPM
jgi:hypothetical protein